MRLLDTTTGHFKWFPDPRAVRYAILSHVWAKPDRKNPAKYRPEQTYDEIAKFEQTTPPDQPILDKLSPKIQGACKIARAHDFNYIWIDSGCIDKSSSAELSEAINSMFEWYRHANICYALLEDVEDESIARAAMSTSGFRNSKWFKRGWTLQELLAPRNVLFISRVWKVIGTKAELADVIAEVTFIRREVLLGESNLEDVPVSERMSWASKRETTREEDEAYCLLGIFGIQMSPIYGEGRYAFIRLQEEILRQTADPTILAWGGWITRPSDYFSLPEGSSLAADPSETDVVSDDPDTAKSYLLALSPRDFESHSATITMTTQPVLPNFDIYSTDFAFTAHGIRAKLPLITIYDKNRKPYRLALLGCKDKRGRCIGLLLQWRRTSTGHRSISIGAFLRDASLSQSGPGRGSADNVFYYRLLALEDADVQAHAAQFQLQDIYIPYRVPPSLRSQARDESIHASLEVYRQETEVSLAGWCPALLKKRGFTVLPDPDSYTPDASMLHEFGLIELSDPQRSEIRIQVGQCTREECAQRGLLQATVITPRPLPPVSQPGSPSCDRPQCHDFHIASWVPQNCVASKTFPIVTAKGDAHTLRLTLRLKSEPGKKFYVLEIELLDPLKGRLPASPPRSLTAMLNLPPANTFSDMGAGGPGEAASSERSRDTALPSSPPPYPSRATNSSGLGLQGLPGSLPESFPATGNGNGVGTGPEDAGAYAMKSPDAFDASASRVGDSSPPVQVGTNSGTLNPVNGVANPVLPNALPNPSRDSSSLPASVIANTLLSPANSAPMAVDSGYTTPNAVNGGLSPPAPSSSSNPLLDSIGSLPDSRMSIAPTPASGMPANVYNGALVGPPLTSPPPSNPYGAVPDPNALANVQNAMGNPNLWSLLLPQLLAPYPHLYGGVPHPSWGALVNSSVNPYAGVPNPASGAPNVVSGYQPAANNGPYPGVNVPIQSVADGPKPVSGGPDERQDQTEAQEKRSSRSSLRRLIPSSWYNNKQKR